MNTYRITYQVTTDVHGVDEGEAVMEGIERVRKAIGDDGSPDRMMWVTGIAREVATGEYHIYSRPYSEGITVVESDLD